MTLHVGSRSNIRPGVYFGGNVFRARGVVVACVFFLPPPPPPWMCHKLFFRLESYGCALLFPLSIVPFVGMRRMTSVWGWVGT